MSTAKKPNQKPESYRPGEKPEIINLAEQKSSKVISTNNGKYIDNVPAIKWGEWQECPYNGCMTLLLNALGARTTYEQVMGLTGSCYRLSMCYGWDPGSSTVHTNYVYLNINADYNANRAYGIDYYSVEDKAVREEQMKRSIDSGVPVLVLGGRRAPEWSIVLGYEITPEGVKYFGRSYFDNNASEDEMFTDNRYVLASNYPGDWESGPRFYDKSCESLRPLDTLKISLETCLEMFKPSDKFGYGAYDLMIKGLENNEYGYVCNIVGSLIDARRAAFMYLKENAGLLTGDNKSKLLTVSSLYKDMFDTLQSVVPYEKLHQNYDYEKFHQNCDDRTLSGETRKELIDALRKSVELERQIRVIVEEILDQWTV